MNQLIVRKISGVRDGKTMALATQRDADSLWNVCLVKDDQLRVVMVATDAEVKQIYDQEGLRLKPGFSDGSGTTVYGMRDGRLLGVATRPDEDSKWKVHLATGPNETLMQRGFHTKRAATFAEVRQIFNSAGLELSITEPTDISIPDFTALEDQDDGAPKRKAAERGSVRVNGKQRIVVVVVAVVILAMLIYPPFHALLPQGIVKGLGYSFVWNPPQFQIGSAELDGTVDVGLLIAQWLGMLVVGGLAFLVCKD